MVEANAMFSLSGKTILVTGGCGHVGRALVHHLVDDGAQVLFSDRMPDQVSELLEGASAKGSGTLSGLVVDLEEAEERLNLVAWIGESVSHLDGIVHNAAFVGTSELDGWAVEFEKQSLDTWRRALEVNLTAPFHLTQQLLPLLKKSANSSIVNIASIYGLIGPDWGLYEGLEMGNPAAYAASKGGLIQLTRWLASTLAPAVRVNSVSPGGIERGQAEEFVRRYLQKTPLARMATENDVVASTVFLLSDASRQITGQNIVVDGGLSVR